MNYRGFRSTDEMSVLNFRYILNEKEKVASNKETLDQLKLP